VVRADKLELMMAGKEPVTFFAGCVIERDYVYVVGKPDELDEEEEFSRLYFYDAQDTESSWIHHDLPDWTVVSLCAAEHTGLAPRVYAALSKHGEIEFTWPDGSKIELIEGAGLKVNRQPVYGYVNAIRQIGDGLYVCGSGGQVYRREASGWRHIADQLKTPAPRTSLESGVSMDELGIHDFAAIDGYADNDIYVAGGAGEVYHYDGTNWTRSAVSSNELLNSIHCADNGEVWVCGFNGTILRGSHKSGFSDVSHYDDNMTFSSIRVFNGEAYLASAEGLFVFNEESKRVEKAVAASLGAIDDANVLDSRDGVLWSFGYKDIVSHDGKVWTRMDHPDNR
jgi:hypothetical protein